MRVIWIHLYSVLSEVSMDIVCIKYRMVCARPSSAKRFIPRYRKQRLAYEVEWGIHGAYNKWSGSIMSTRIRRVVSGSSKYLVHTATWGKDASENPTPSSATLSINDRCAKKFASLIMRFVHTRMCTNVFVGQHVWVCEADDVRRDVSAFLCVSFGRSELGLSWKGDDLWRRLTTVFVFYCS